MIASIKNGLRRAWYGGLSRREFQAPDWQHYRIDLSKPFVEIEPLEQEKHIVDRALGVLKNARILSSPHYDPSQYLAMRQAIAHAFEIPWTAITPRMQRLIYAVNAIHRPQVMIAAGVFCGNTFISNAGAAVGPGAVYEATALVGLEIDPREAERAESNVRRMDSTGVARIVAEDAVTFCADWGHPIDLLYLDADDVGGRGKSIYMDIAREAWDKMPDGALLLAHNSVNSEKEIREYLSFVRNPTNCRASVNVIVDTEGLEVSVKGGRR